MNFSCWKESVREYLLNSSSYWGDNTLHKDRLVQIKKTICDKYKVNDKDFVDFVISISEKRESGLPKLYLSNMGGSGSHWISAMIQELIGWVDLGEVYFPPFIYTEIEKLPDKESAAKFYDTIEVLYGFLYELDVEKFSSAKVINSVHSPHRIPFHKGLFKNSQIIYLYRDPRDLALSTTYRKDKYRQYAHSEKTDKEYLIYNATNRVRKSYLKYNSQTVKADFELKYEEIKNDTEGKLKDICKLLNEPINEEKIKYISSKFNAKKIAKTNDTLKTNLYTVNGKLADNWEKTANHIEKRIMHAIMKVAIVEEGYNIGDCFGGITEYNKQVLINKSTYDILMKYHNNCSIFINGRWKSPLGNIKEDDIVDAVKLDAYLMEVESIAYVLKNVDITLLCLNGLSQSELLSTFKHLHKIEVPYIDASMIKNFPAKKILKKFKKVIQINLSGCNVKLPKKYVKLATVDF